MCKLRARRNLIAELKRLPAQGLITKKTITPEAAKVAKKRIGKHSQALSQLLGLRGATTGLRITALAAQAGKRGDQILQLIYRGRRTHRVEYPACLRRFGSRMTQRNANSHNRTQKRNTPEIVEDR